MAAFLRPFVLGTAALSMAAQSPEALLKAIPATAAHVEFTWRPVEAEARYKATLSVLDPKGTLLGLETKAHVGLKDLARGPVAVATFPREGQAPAPGAKESSWDVLFLPVKDAAAFSTRVAARKEGDLRTYRWQGAQGEQVRYLAFRGGYAIVAARKALLQQVLKGGPGLNGELADLLPWMTTQDSLVVLTSGGTSQALEGFKEGIGKAAEAKGPANPAAIFLGPRMTAWAEEAQASVRHMAMALDLHEEGAVRLTLKAFFKPGSPMAKQAAESAPMEGSTLAGLPEGPFALAMGGQWPAFMDTVGQVGLDSPVLQPEDREALKAAMELQAGQVSSIAFSLGVPQPGRPFLSGLQTVTRVKDQAAWLKGVELQQDRMAARLGGVYTVQRFQVEGRAGHTLSMDLAGISGDKLPPAQVSMMGALLFGGSRMTLSQVAVDDHTFLAVFGDEGAVRAAQARWKSGGKLADGVAMQDLHARFPKGARFGFFVHPKGLQDLVQGVMGAFGQAKEAGPDLGAVAPVGGVLTVDDGGVQFTGIATTESLRAFGAIFKAFEPKGKPKPSR